MVICLERGADLHMAQLMQLPLTVSCFRKIHTGFTFLVPAHPGSPGQRAVKRVCVYCNLKPNMMTIRGVNQGPKNRSSLLNDSNPGFKLMRPVVQKIQLTHKRVAEFSRKPPANNNNSDIYSLLTTSLRSLVDTSRCISSTILRRIARTWVVCAYAVFFT